MKALPKVEQVALALKAQAGDRDALSRLVETNLPFVHAVVRRTHRGRLEYEDAVQHGVIGLMTAIRKFDASFGFTLLTYAAPWIRQAIQRAAIETGEIVYVPTLRFHAGQRAAVSSLDAPVSGEPGSETWLDQLAAPEAEPPDLLSDLGLDAAIDCLGPRIAFVIRSRFGFGCDEMTLAEIGKVLNLSRERVRQLEAEGLRRLRPILEARAA